MTLELASRLKTIVRERPGLVDALLGTGHGSLVLELPMRNWGSGYFGAALKTTGEMPDPK